MAIAVQRGEPLLRPRRTCSQFSTKLASEAGNVAGGETSSPRVWADPGFDALLFERYVGEDQKERVGSAGHFNYGTTNKIFSVGATKERCHTPTLGETAKENDSK